MCGIAGVYHLDNSKIPSGKLERFTDSMFHRGPDGSGYSYFENNTLGLGHRRLSILDLTEAGKQPMTFSDERYWITYNGEIFNFLELRDELEKLGYTFKSNSDTEVILASYDNWGDACLDKFNGMWAFAIWDELEKKLFLARDRFGIKPLYYLHITNELFAFASETIAFKNLEDYKRSFNEENLKASFDNSLLLEGIGLTIFDNIYQLLPGHTITFKKGEVLKQQRWYDIRKKNEQTKLSYSEQVIKFKNLFEDACRIRLRSDVPVASALSGGLDSSSVYCMIHHLKKSDESNIRNPSNWQKAITATFPNTDMNEVEYAKIVAEYVGLENWKCVTNSFENLAEEVATTTIKFDAISSTAMASITAIYKGIRDEGIVVSLDGHGVDEMLFGYRYMLYDLLNHYQKNGTKEECINVADILSNLYMPELVEKSKNKFENDILSTFKKRSDITYKFKTLIKKIISIEEEKNKSYNHLEKVSDEMYDFSDYPFEQRILLNDFFIYSLPTFLRDFDRASMQSSVEIRMPFMDYRIVEFLFSLPIESKIENGYTKRILRDAMEGIVPDEIIKRTYKIGIGAPLKNWFENYLLDFIFNKINTETFEYVNKFEGLNINVIKENIKNKTLTSRDSNALWRCINFTLIDL